MKRSLAAEVGQVLSSARKRVTPNWVTTAKRSPSRQWRGRFTSTEAIGFGDNPHRKRLLGDYMWLVEFSPLSWPVMTIHGA